jgi:hypothetical protein
VVAVEDLAAAPDFFGAVDFAVVDGFPVAAFPVLAAAFFVDFDLAEDEALGFVVASPEDWPVTGVTTISAERRPDKQRVASREAEFGGAKSLISSLYAAFAAMQQP